ncbi:MAG: ankyrin repeat domain-containing protein [Gemmatimonadetes bacterium]|nr:ankyrin repeat domain-containing protein [Gemmatimonadota bacterium]
MAHHELPARPSLEYLKKLAKDRLRELRGTDPDAKLADAQLAVAREHGFSSWRALKAEVERRGASSRDAFLAACTAGDLDALRERLGGQPELANARNGQGATALHLALAHPDAVRLLLEHGADPNARDTGDNALPLHFAASGAPIETVEALLDAGSDVHGAGDAHALDVIGWAACFGEPRRDVVALLLARGARHHVFSAVALGDQAALRRLVADDESALRRRLARTEQEQTALHYCVAPPDGLVGGLFRTGEHYRTLELLIELGAKLEARDAKGRTPLAVAMLRGDREAMSILHRAGAREPDPAVAMTSSASMVSLAKSVVGLVPMIAIPDIDAAVAWYRAVGFELTGCNGEEGNLDWAEVALGEARLMFALSGDAWRPGTTGLSLWLYTSRIDDLYGHLKRRQLDRSRALLADVDPELAEIRFRTDLYTTHYGMREFAIEDPNGVLLTFTQPAE